MYKFTRLGETYTVTGKMYQLHTDGTPGQHRTQDSGALKAATLPQHCGGGEAKALLKDVLTCVYVAVGWWCGAEWITFSSLACGHCNE